MPPLKNESPGDKATRLLKKANQINQKVSYNRVMAALKSRPDLCSQIEAQLAAYGALEPLPADTGSKQQSSPAVLPKPPAGPLALLDGSQGAPTPTKHEAGHQAEHEEELPAETGAPASFEDDKKFEKNIALVGQVLAKTIKKALMMCEPASFSEGNFKSILKRGAKDVNARFLLDLLEFCTNLGDSTSLPPGCRSQSAFAHRVMKNYHDKGRRGRDLQLQAAMPWGKVGVYMIQKRDEQLDCVNKVLKQEVAIPVVGEEADYFIDTNYSELRAMIGSTLTHYRQPCVLLFGCLGGGADDTPKKGTKRPRASPSPGASSRTGASVSSQGSLPSSGSTARALQASILGPADAASAEEKHGQVPGSGDVLATGEPQFQISAEAGFVPSIPSSLG